MRGPVYECPVIYTLGWADLVEIDEPQAPYAGAKQQVRSVAAHPLQR